MTSDTTEPVAQPVEQTDLDRLLQHSDPAKAEAYTRFKEIVAALEAMGWERYKVDTLVHPVDAELGRDRMTVRHHYSAGEWEFSFELDQAWNPRAPRAGIVRIVASRLVPTVPEALSQLFGRLLRRYQPIPGGMVLNTPLPQEKWHHVNGRENRPPDKP